MKLNITRLINISVSILFILSISCLKKDVDEYAMVTFMMGDVKKNNVIVDIGDIINEKDIITTGPDSFCDIRIGESIIRVKQKTKMVVSNLIRRGDLENTVMGLKIGKMLCKPKKLLKSESFIVKTPTAVAGVRGTKFVVEADKFKTTRIKVFDGKVKIASRIKQFEKNVDKLLEVASVVSRKEMIVVTKKELNRAEKLVEKMIKSEKGKELKIDKIISRSKKNIIIPKKSIMKFALEDFSKENKEIIQIKERPKEVVRQIIKYIELEKDKPKPDGRLLITRYQVYFIKNGKVAWGGKIIGEPIRIQDKIYVASGDYIFCASKDGPVLWRKSIKNDGKLKLRDNKLIIKSRNRETALDLETGQQL
ncbi:FecR domain-containing protein [Spirochaetota bacterium]